MQVVLVYVHVKKENVEEFIEARETKSPSAQFRTSPMGEVLEVSTGPVAAARFTVPDGMKLLE